MTDLPSDGVVTRAVFEGLPTPVRGWAWELRAGRLTLVHSPVSFWHWQIIMRLLGYWQQRGHQVAGEQYVAESYWIVRGDAETDETDGMVTMHELRDGGYEVTGHRLVSRL